MLRNIQSFVGKPFIIMPKFNHPTPEDGSQMFKAQEPYRVGTIIETGVDTSTGKAWGVAEITKPEAITAIKSGEVKFVSPSIVFHGTDLMKTSQGEIITNFVGAHVAGVKDPAFGMTKAQIKGQCSGDTHTCHNQLMSVQASVEKKVSPCGNITSYKVAGDACMEDCFHDKKEAGKDVTDPQNIAICMSECGESDAKSGLNSSDIVKNDNSSNNMQDTEILEQIKSFSAALSDVKASLAELKSKKADSDMTDNDPDQKESKKKLLKNRSSAQNDPDAKNTAGSNDYSDDDIDEDAMDVADQKASPKQAPSKTVAAMQEKLDRMEKTPIINEILNAKTDLGLVSADTRQAEFDHLIKSSISELARAQAEFTKIASAQKQPQLPYVRYTSASLNGTGSIQTADKFIQEAIL